MGQPQKRKHYHKGDVHLRRRWKVKRRKKDLDQIDTDLKVENAPKLLHQEIDLDKPGEAQHYCLHCARYFIDKATLKEHFRTKAHKRRMKALEAEPYTIEESLRAAGQGSFYKHKIRKITTQPMDDDPLDPATEDVDMKKQKTSDNKDVASTENTVKKNWDDGEEKMD